MKAKKPKIKKVLFDDFQVRPQYDFGGQFKAALPGALTTLGGVGMEIASGGMNPSGYGMIAGGLGSAIGGVDNYNQQQKFLAHQQTNNQFSQQNPLQTFSYGGYNIPK